MECVLIFLVDDFVMGTLLTVVILFGVGVSLLFSDGEDCAEEEGPAVRLDVICLFFFDPSRFFKLYEFLKFFKASILIAALIFFA